jgi:protein phosphatase
MGRELAERLAFGAASDVGAVRDHNEDAVLAVPPLFVVADGMGGHAAGDVASALAIEAVREVSRRSEPTAADIRSAVAAANAALLTHEDAHPETEGMGTTITGICLGSGDGQPRWIVFNVGDSRVYRFAAGELTQVTTDHSEVQELIAAGRIPREMAAFYPRRNVVTRSLGSDPAPEPDVWELPASPGERFVVCSDGLSNELADADIAAVLDRTSSAQEAADALVRAAVEAGGHDNVSVIVVALGD